MSTISTTVPGHLDGVRDRHDVPGIEPDGSVDALRLSTWFGVVFVAAQLLVMVAMTIFVLPHGGGPDEPALSRGQQVHAHADLYRAGNYAFMLAGTLLLGFLGAVSVRLRRVDRSGVLATVAVAAGTLLAVVWPLGGLLHDVALEVAGSGTDLRILGGWDAVAPFTLAFSVMPRLFLVGAVALGLRAAASSPWLVRSGVVIMVVSLAGSATLVSGALFPLLALSSLAYEIWLGLVAVHWLRNR
jgi:hypothetical protein